MLEIVKWSGTTICLIGTAVTNLNLYPYNIYCGFIGSCLWAFAGFKQKDYALFSVEIVAVVMYTFGLGVIFK